MTQSFYSYVLNLAHKSLAIWATQKTVAQIAQLANV
jgi:hypothetical protein